MSATIDLAPIIAIAEEAHAGQFRNDGVTPYITHVRGVAESFAPEHIGLRAVAWLHDTIEDSGGRFTAETLLEAGISPWVVQAVVALTKQEGVDYDTYLINVKANHMACKVKIADILYNLSDSPSRNQVKKYAKALKFLLDPL